MRVYGLYPDMEVCLLFSVPETGDRQKMMENFRETIEIYYSGLSPEEMSRAPLQVWVEGEPRAPEDRGEAPSRLARLQEAAEKALSYLDDDRFPHRSREGVTRADAVRALREALAGPLRRSRTTPPEKPPRRAGDGR